MFIRTPRSKSVKKDYNKDLNGELIKTQQFRRMSEMKQFSDKKQLPEIQRDKYNTPLRQRDNLNRSFITNKSVERKRQSNYYSDFEQNYDIPVFTRPIQQSITYARTQIDSPEKKSTFHQRAYFSTQKMQSRIMSLVRLLQNNNTYTLMQYLNEQNLMHLEDICKLNVEYKFNIMLEWTSLFCHYFVLFGISHSIESQKLYKLIVLYHYSSTHKYITQTDLDIVGVNAYMQQFYQFQLMNPTIPTTHLKLNTLLTQAVDQTLKNLADKQISHNLKKYKDDCTIKSFHDMLKDTLHFVIESELLIPKNDNVYTLVIDLDETLVHFSDDGKQKSILIRPYVDLFINEMANYYELVIFTAGLQQYADWVVDQLDPLRLIKYRLYRHHTIQRENNLIKDLNKLGRPLNKTIIIDNTPQNFLLQPQNGISIKTWTSDPRDEALKELIPVLIELSKVKDVRIKMKQLKVKSQYFILPN
ncbi:hypothetical protein pb186bvf_014680 [Paramecium bursaria]